MDHISYFKLQAKNLFKDFKTRTPVFNEVIKGYLNEYTPKFFDVDSIFCAWGIDENNFSLMKAQHIIAQMVGFEKWADLSNASETELELAKLLFDNQDKAHLDNWDIYISMAEDANNLTFDSETRLEIFKEVVMKWDPADNRSPDYRLKRT